MNEESLMKAIRDLREHMGMSQNTFAVMVLKKTAQTQYRYETVKPPPPVQLASFVHIARKANRDDLAELFKDAAIETVPDEIRELIREPEHAPTNQEKTAQQGRINKKRALAG